MDYREWKEAPPDFTPYYPCWVLGKENFVFLATWQSGKKTWKIGKGIDATPEEITHYQILLPPNAPRRISERHPEYPTKEVTNG